jgi:hypothetical protein
VKDALLRASGPEGSGKVQTSRNLPPSARAAGRVPGTGLAEEAQPGVGRKPFDVAVLLDARSRGSRSNKRSPVLRGVVWIRVPIHSVAQGAIIHIGRH